MEESSVTEERLHCVARLIDGEREDGLGEVTLPRLDTSHSWWLKLMNVVLVLAGLLSILFGAMVFSTAPSVMQAIASLLAIGFGVLPSDARQGDGVGHGRSSHPLASFANSSSVRL